MDPLRGEKSLRTQDKNQELDSSLVEIYPGVISIIVYYSYVVILHRFKYEDIVALVIN